jgi:hypothetical protein
MTMSVAALAYMLQLRLLFAVLVKTWPSYLTLPGAAAGGKGLTEWWLRVGVSVFVVMCGRMAYLFAATVPRV